MCGAIALAKNPAVDGRAGQPIAAFRQLSATLDPLHAGPPSPLGAGQRPGTARRGYGVREIQRRSMIRAAIQQT